MTDQFIITDLGEAYLRSHREAQDRERRDGSRPAKISDQEGRLDPLDDKDQSCRPSSI